MIAGHTKGTRALLVSSRPLSTTTRSRFSFRAFRATN